MGKYTIRKRIASVVIGVATVASLSGAAVLVPTVASADAISDLQAQIAALTAQLAALSGTPAVPNASSCTFTEGASLYIGSTGESVRCLQQYLNEKGFKVAVSGAGSPGSETTYFGSRTAQAVASWQSANGVPTGGYPGYFGPKSKAKYNELIAAGGGTTLPPPPPPCTGSGCTTPPPPPVTGGGVSVTSAAQPSNSLAPLNAVNLPYTKITLTAGAGDVVVNGITVERVGLGVDANFSGVVLLDENGTQMDIVKTLGSDHRATIGGTFVVKAGTSRTLTVAGNMQGSATSYAGQVIALSVVAVNTTGTVSGTLPITGAQHTMNASLTIGSVTLAKGSIDPGSSISKPVGTTGYTFSAVRVTAGSAEKVYLRSIRWNQTGSAGSGDIANVKTIVDGTEYAAVVSADGKYYVTTFPENGGKGLLIDKGFTKELSIKGDVAGGSGRTIDFDIAKRTDIGLVGETYGYGIKAPQTGASVPTADTSAFSSGEDPWYDASQVTVQSGTITVSSSNIVPAGNIAVNAPDVALAGFQVEVKGEPVSVGGMVFNFALSNGTAGTAASGNATHVTNVSVVKEDGTILAGPVDGANITTGTAGKVTFTSSVTFPVGTSKIKLIGKLGTNFATNDTFQASTTPSSSWTSVTGQTTGNTITPSPTSAISGLTMTIKAAALKVSASSLPTAQTVIANASQFVFANYILDTGSSGEDIRVTSLPLELNVTTGSATDISNCQLYDGATSVTSSNIVAPSAAASNTSFVFNNNGLVLTKGTQKTLAMKCDIKSGSSGSYKWGLDGAQDGTSFTAATGLTSGQTINDSTAFVDSEGQLMSASANGTLATSIDSGSSGSLSYRLVSPGQTVELIKIKYTATNEDIDIKRVALKLSNTASNSPADLLGQQVTLWDGTTQVGTATFDQNTDRATSTLNTPVRVTKNNAKIITVKGTIGSIGSSGANLSASGDLLTVDYDGANTGINGNYGTGVESGATIAGGTSNTTANGVRIVRAYPEFASDSLSSSEKLLVAGDGRTLYKFKVTAKGDAGTSVDLYKLSFTVSSSTLTATTTKFGLYAFTDSSYSTPDSNFNNTNNPGGLINAGNCYNSLLSSSAVRPVQVEIYPATTSCSTGTTTLAIPAGESRWFKLVGSVASVQAAATTETIQVQLDGDAAFPVNSTVNNTNMETAVTTDGDSNDDFIWSPRSTTTTQSLTDLDFTNGYGVVGLPSTNMTIETLKNN